MENIKIGIDVDSLPIAKLRSELKRTVEQLHQLEVGTAEFDKLNQKASAIRDKMNEVNEQIAVFATGSKYEQVSNSLGEIGAGLRDMDFDRVVQGANLFAKTSKSITFGDAVKTVKQLGQTFVTVGKAILTNPLFLLAGVITLIGVGIYKLLDKLGVVKKAFEYVGKAIDVVVQSIKDFLDWIGLTDFKALDEASKKAQKLEKEVETLGKTREKLSDQYDHEAQIAELRGEQVIGIEKKKQYAIIETSKEQYHALEAQKEALKIAGELTLEKQKEINTAMREMKKNISEARQALEIIDEKAKKEAREKDENAKKEAQARAKEAQARAKAYAQDRINAQRQIQDSELALMKDGLDKELKANEIKYQRLIEDTKKNEKLLSSEKQKLIEQLRKEEIQKENEIIQAETDKINEALKLANNERAEKQKEEAQAKIDQQKQMLEIGQQAVSEYLKKIQEQDKARLDARKSTYESFMGAMSNLAQALEEQGVKTAGLQKTLALVQLAVDTAKAIGSVISGATAAASAGGPLAPFLVAGYIASGVATVTTAMMSAKKILSSAPSIGGGGGAGGSMQPSASTFQGSTFTPSQAPTMYGNEGTNNFGNTPNTPQNYTISANVVANDIEAKLGTTSKLNAKGVL